ncbi:hypothetical protein [Pelotalea chapellei]|uniref:YXWGXW repeat-containing protein n=1 Tax=Pelotalea chapellei TaxID=44671 RepID=A0ABS5U3J6_9BACT|nr:hypothetical protein [Pelotalea chapellei]MBT1070225.1 hypothetical protein [Pelotalea chapellei]
MKKIRYVLIALSLLLCSTTSVSAQVSIGIGLPNVSIGINLPLFPELVPVPGYPVYYAPRIEANYFFYDGMYWIYQDDNWYASSWYNGPWWIVQPEVVPLFILRVPVRYYRQPPVYFRGWYSDAPPRWGNHWGHAWEQRRRGWDQWKRSSVPARAPLPVYQRKYSGDRYPRLEQQDALRSQSYRYQPRDKVVRQHFRQQAEQRKSAPSRIREETPASSSRRDVQQSPGTFQRKAPEPAVQPAHRSGEDARRAQPARPIPRQRDPEDQGQRQRPEAVQREQQGQRQRPEAVQREQRVPRTYDRSEQREPGAHDRGEQQDRRESQERGHGQRGGQRNDGERGR